MMSRLLPLSLVVAGLLAVQAPARGDDSWWIGVRVSPVPEALAAHMDQSGLMIANLVVDGPAEQAGVRRYDVVVSFDGAPVTTLEELTAAIAAAGGRAAELTVMRGGKSQVLPITPQRRPAPDARVTFRWDDPEAAEQQYEHYFGHRLRLDDQGKWLFEPLGRLKDLPDAVRAIPEDPAWRVYTDSWRELHRDPFVLRLSPDGRVPWSDSLFFAPGDSADGDVQIQVHVSTDGAATHIERRSDGRIIVERTSPDGTTARQEYESVDQFAAQDPQGHTVYRRYVGFRGRPWVTISPGHDLGQLQAQFREQLEESARRWQEELGRARLQLERAREQLEGQFSGRPGLFGSSSMQSRVEVRPDGRVRIELNRGGETSTYEFNSIDELQQNEPEVYEMFRDVLRLMRGGTSRPDAGLLALC